MSGGSRWRNHWAPGEPLLSSAAFLWVSWSHELLVPTFSVYRIYRVPLALPPRSPCTIPFSPMAPSRYITQAGAMGCMKTMPSVETSKRISKISTKGSPGGSLQGKNSHLQGVVFPLIRADSHPQLLGSTTYSEKYNPVPSPSQGRGDEPVFGKDIFPKGWRTDTN